MIAVVRQYLMTILITGVCLIWDAPTTIFASSIVIAFLFDTFVIRKSVELDLYRSPLDFRAAARRQMSWREALRLQVMAILAGSTVVILAYAFSARQLGQQSAGMVAILLGLFAASFSGLQLVLLKSWAPRDLLKRFDTMPDVLAPLDALPNKARLIAAALIRLALGIVAILPFVALAGLLHTEQFRAPMLWIIPSLFVFFQLGAFLLLQGLFLLRWREGGGREVDTSTG